MTSDGVKKAGHSFSPALQDSDGVNTGLSCTESRDLEPARDWHAGYSEAVLDNLQLEQGTSSFS